MIVVCIAVIGLGMSSGMMPDMKALAGEAVKENRDYALMLDGLSNAGRLFSGVCDAQEPCGMKTDGVFGGVRIASHNTRLLRQCRKWTRDWG